MRFPYGKSKAVTLSYDDGCQEDIRFSRVISEAGLKCTFNLNSEKGRSDALRKEQIQECFLDKGHEIAVHGANHRAEGVIRAIEGISEVIDCRRELEQKFGIIVRGMAYPDRLLNVLKTFPKLTVVGAHFAGWSVWDEALEKLASFENLYVDSSSTLGFAKDEAKVKMLIEGWGEDKIMFASDYPMWKAADEIKMLEKLNLSDTAYEKIFHLNAEKSV